MVSTLQPLFNFDNLEDLTPSISSQSSLISPPIINTPPIEDGEEFMFPVGSEPIYIDLLKPLSQHPNNHAPKESVLSSSPVFFTSNFAERFPITKYHNEEETMAEVRRSCPKRVTGHHLRLVGLNRWVAILSRLILKRTMNTPSVLPTL